MENSLVFLLIALLIKGTQAKCRTPVDCLAVSEGIDGVTVEGCPGDISAGGGGAAGGGAVGGGAAGGVTGKSGGAMIQVACCEDVTYMGSKAAHYEYDGTCPVFVEVTDIQLDAGEVIHVKNVFCEEQVGCKIFIIDDTALAPFTLPISGSAFTINSLRSNVSITFRVVNEECSCSGDCPPMWTPFEGQCYYVTYQPQPWGSHKNHCLTQDAVITPIYNDNQWDFLYDLAGPLTWVGLHCRNVSNPNWYWETSNPESPVLNTLGGLWEQNYPLAAVNRHCALFPQNGDKHLENNNCNSYHKSVCCKPVS